MKKRLIASLITIICVVVLVSVGYLFFYSEKCEDISCFNKNLVDCSRASYVHKADWAYEYKIKGVEEDSCVIEAELIFAGLEPRFDPLLGKKMNCFMPLRMTELPHNNMDFCTGPLKEEMQYLVIKELYLYTSQNLGK